MSKLTRQSSKTKNQSTQKEQTPQNPIKLNEFLIDSFTGTADIEIYIPENSNQFIIKDRPNNNAITRTLDDELKWKDDDAQYTTRFKKGNWDGYHHLFTAKNKHSTAPIGLLKRAVGVLNDQFDYSIEVKIDSVDSTTIETEWYFEPTLRKYQAEAIYQAQEHKGGIISIPTGGGKTIVALKLINILEQQSIIFVHTKQLLRQWEEKIKSVLGIEPAIIGGDQWNEGDITIASMQKVHSQGAKNLDDEYGIAIFDECHITSAADTMQDIGLSINTEWRFGLSATPWRANPGEDLEIEAAIGGVTTQVTAEHLIDQGYLAEPKFKFIEGDFKRPSNDDYHTVYRNCIELAPNRNGAIAEKAISLAKNDHSVLIPVNRINQGKLIQHALAGTPTDDIIEDIIDEEQDDADVTTNKFIGANDLPDHSDKTTNLTYTFIDASASESKREETYNALESGELDILITTLIKEGADIPTISAIVHAEGGKSKKQRIQRIGRALRPKNGDKAYIIDVKDAPNYRFIGNHYIKRVQALNEYYGKYGPSQSANTSQSKSRIVKNTN